MKSTWIGGEDMQLNAKKSQIEFRFDIRGGITLVVGDSGAGKTYLYRLIQEAQTLGEYGDVLLFNLADEKHGSVSEQLAALDPSGKLIIIDNSDVLLTVEDRKFIRKDAANGNDYLLFGRDPEWLNLSVRSITEIQRNGAVFTLAYADERRKPDVEDTLC